MGEAKVITRHKDDNYETPPKLAAWMVQHAIGLSCCRPEDLCMVEPGCGDTAPFLRAAFRCGVKNGLGVELHSIPTIELSAEAAGAEDARVATCSALDYTKITEAEASLFFNRVHGGDGFDIVATNPPFRDAEAFISETLRRHLAPNGIAAFLLRLGFLASQKRAGLYALRPPLEVWVMQSRPSFTKDGCTDSSEYGIYFWGGKLIDQLVRGKGATALHWLASKELVR